MSEIIAAILALLLTSITGYLFSRFLKSSKTTNEKQSVDIRVLENKHNMPDKDFPFPITNLGAKIYLWGPPGTGKTWLVNSFIRKVNLIEQALSSSNQSIETGIQYDLWIEDFLYRRAISKSLELEATSDIDYQRYTLHRNIMPYGIKEVCEIGMLDGPGGETTGEIVLYANNPENRAKVLAAHEALKDADYLLVTVDRGSLPLSEEHNGQTKNAGKHYIERLQELLSLKRNPNQRAIICFTKCDLYGSEFGNMDSALARLFGEAGREVGVLLSELNKHQKTPPIFYFTSAVGYYYEGQSGKIIPNADFDNRLRSVEQWNPYNVHKPFFDVLDYEQEKFIREKSKSVFVGKLPIMGHAFVADRLDFFKKYSYSAMMEMIGKSIDQS